MGESYTNVTEGSGKKQHSWQRTVGANNVEDSLVIDGEPWQATYAFTTDGAIQVPSEAGTAWFTIQAGSSLHVRIKRIIICQYAAATAAGALLLSAVRTSTAPTGGTTAQKTQMDTADAAAGATATYISNTTYTAEPTYSGDTQISFTMPVVVTQPNTSPVEIMYGDTPGTKPPIISAGTSNGWCIYYVSSTGVTGSPTFTIAVEVTETAYK